MNGHNRQNGHGLTNGFPETNGKINGYHDNLCEKRVEFETPKERLPMPPSEPIAIIGTALRFPGGATSPRKLWEMLRDPPSHLSRTPPPKRFGSAGFFHADPEHHGTSNSERSYFLDQDIRAFDAPFFNIAPLEAEAIDPQHRLLLEVVYEALEAGGIPLEKTRGTDTAVYVGQMSNDYWDHLLRDLDSIPKYMATGTARSITANRLSYFFDWHGPSLSIDTACSSSMVALHHAVQALRAGHTGMAVAAGCHLVLGPESYVIESKLRMISPTGTCKMWDSSADGYARAEGCAALVLKTLSRAQRDGDPIIAVVRETGVNQDGRTRGITMPSAEAQAALIKDTYLRAGLDSSRPEDQPQFFEAHGTGTLAGDPIEAEAIHLAFFGDTDQPTSKRGIYGKLPVGSIKTVVGHLEATAGLAGILKAIVSMRNQTITPNLWFENLNPKIDPFYGAVRIPTKAEPWPAKAAGGILRCSVNSFGFGGTNAHTILESYEADSASPNLESAATLVVPIALSAASPASLAKLVQQYQLYLSEHPDLDLTGLAHTLLTRRSALPYRAAFSGANANKVIAQMSETLHAIKDTSGANFGTLVRQGSGAGGRPKILGIFTGQGAQWPGMGRELLSSSKVFLDSIKLMDKSLSTLPDPPTWSLYDELMASKVSSTEEASIAQPLSLALQVGLVDLLRASGVTFDSVVAHSSGEIGAAYATGLLTIRDAIRIAYYRGKYSTLATPGGGMMAVGLSYEAAQDFCNHQQLKGRVTAAASNSPKSTTLSGSLEALQEAAELLGDTFHRLLKVDKAYHSDAMIPCCKTFQAALDRCGIQVQQPNHTLWISSVREGQEPKSFAEALAGPYWVETLYKPVLFSQALSHVFSMRSFDAALEIGPHPALKGPSIQTYAEFTKETSSTLPYKGVLERSRHDGEAFASCLGFLWQELGWCQFDSYIKACATGPTTTSKVFQDLPTYPWNHNSTYWAESKKSHSFRFRERFHPLLGFRSNEDHGMDIKWRNLWSLKEMPWLKAHVVQGQVVVPGVCYVVLGIEAATRLKGKKQTAGTIEIEDITIHRALIMSDDENKGVDVFVTVSPQEASSECVVAKFDIYASSDVGQTPYRVCSAKINISYSESSSEGELAVKYSSLDENEEMSNVQPASFYLEMEKIGLRWDEPFLCDAMQRVHYKSVVSVARSKTDTHARQLLLSPALLDVGFQGALVGFSAPGDGRLWNPYIPTHIDRCVFDIGRLRLNGPDLDDVQFSSFVLDSTFPNLSSTATFTCDIHGTYSSNGAPFLKIEGLTFSCVSPAQESDDREMFTEEVWVPRSPSVIGMQLKETTDPLGRASDFVKQMSLVNPRMKILEFGGSIKLITSVLKSLDGAFSRFEVSYPRDLGGKDNLAVQLEHVRDCFEKHSKRIAFSPLEAVNISENRDFVQESYDLIISSKVLQPEDDTPKSNLNSLRRLLKPGGLVVFSTTKCPSSWTQYLNDHGFNGVGLVLSQAPGLSLIVSESKGNCNLEQTLSPGSSTQDLPEVMIIGGNSPELLDVIQEVQRTVSLRGAKFAVVKSLSELGSYGIPIGATVLCLADLDVDTLKSPTAETLDGMKVLFDTARLVLWVTKGRRFNNPHASMIVGLGRSVISESPLLRLQFLDVEDSLSEPSTRKTIADCFQTLAYQDVKAPLNGCGQSIEPEMVLSHGRLLIPRVQTLATLNNRLNCQNRVIKTAVLHSGKSILEIVRSGSFCSVQQFDCPPTGKTIAVSHSLNLPLQFSDRIAGYLGLGKTSSGDSVLILSSNNRSLQLLDACAVVPCPFVSGMEAGLLMGIASTIFVRTALEMTETGKILLHQPNEMTYHIASGMAQAMSSELCISTSSLNRAFSARISQGVSRAVISQFTTWRSLKKDLSRSIDSLLYLPGLTSFEDIATGAHLAKLTPDKCKRLVMETVTAKNHDGERPLSSRCIEQAKHTLITALQDYNRHNRSIMPVEHEQLACKDLAEVPGMSTTDSIIRVISWTLGSEVEIHTRPKDPTGLISSDKTYLFVGLTGDLGRSLVLRMIRAGLRHVVLTSRSPHIPESWLKACKEIASDVNVRVMKMNVTNEEDVRRVYRDIKKTMPPVGGVANAAMVMDDCLFSELDVKAFNRVTDPKVAGSMILDRLFYDDNLDFFVLFSSISSVVGNRGQSSYCAANLAETTIAAQRRSRGLAASALALGMVVGVGYVARASTTVDSINQNMRLQNGIPLGETDVHNAFFESILRGKEMHGSPELITGVRSVRSEDSHLPLWHDNPRFSHLSRLDDSIHDVNSENRTGQSKIPVKDRLQHAATPEEATEAVRDALKTKLEFTLKSHKEDIPDDIALVQLGVDSLSAVEIRSWFVKEVGCDIPVLKILNGASVNSLCAGVMEQFKK
ncbi:beta-ketoacyl synthase domain-containing protein [Colletotrichum tofieldiae]|uniref:Beta-ketoacyl synthase domain-containing protein n=1 Tax=Colletotrichum tofieldiae TaxID=708197 RepID=A0A161WKT9_9PEZI|nr:beta-ketoacyl synthase domain-containing protein [Colletotrichum tofieldiae]